MTCVSWCVWQQDGGPSRAPPLSTVARYARPRKAARASAAAVRRSSDAYGNEYFAHAPTGEPLGVALGIAIRLTISSAIARLHEGVVGLTLLHGAR
jgi:hypothetical protein